MIIIKIFIIISSFLKPEVNQCLQFYSRTIIEF